MEQAPGSLRVSVVDSHCHLADAAFRNDLDAVIRRARDAGVVGLLCVLAAGDSTEAEQASHVAARWPETRLALGVHPHQAGAFAGRAADVLEIVATRLASDTRISAVGEIGLDYHYDFAPRVVQQEVFRAQIRLARQTGRPVVVHTREAWPDTFAALDEEGRGEVRGVFHCFTGDAPIVERVVASGFHVSFSGILTFPRAHELRAAARLVPRDRLLVETDSPYLAPVPHRGRRNEPAWVIPILQTLAEIRGEPLTEVAKATTANFNELFGPFGSPNSRVTNGLAR